LYREILIPRSAEAANHDVVVTSSGKKGVTPLSHAF
jgi:hypothetical protein